MGYIPDLEEVEWWHATDFAYSKSIPKDFNAIMVGWLGSNVPSTGEVLTETIKKLEWACDNRTIDQAWLGEHECEICGNYADRGEILVIDGEKMYVAPRMILHYIQTHSYRPPEDFLSAVDKIDVT